MVEVTASDEALILDFESLTTKAADDSSIATAAGTATSQVRVWSMCFAVFLLCVGCAV